MTQKVSLTHVSVYMILYYMIYVLTAIELSPGGCIYTGCPRRNVPDFGRVFLMVKYTDITQKTYVQS